MAEENKQRLRTIIEEIGKINSNERLEKIWQEKHWKNLE